MLTMSSKIQVVNQISEADDQAQRTWSPGGLLAMTSGAAQVAGTLRQSFATLKTYVGVHPMRAAVSASFAFGHLTDSVTRSGYLHKPSRLQEVEEPHEGRTLMWCGGAGTTPGVKLGG